MKRQTHSFNVLVSPEIHQHLLDLATHHQTSAGAIIRKLIRSSWTTTFTTMRSCASGERCLFPNPNVPAALPDLKTLHEHLPSPPTNTPPTAAP